MPRFQLRSICAALVLAGCAHPNAQIADGIAPSTQYEIYRDAVSEWAASHRDWFATAPTRSSSGAYGTLAAQVGSSAVADQKVVFTGSLDVFDADPAEGRSSNADEELMRLAQTMELLRAQLRALGYPANIYEGAVADFESTSIRALSAGKANPIYDDESMTRLIARIDAARAVTNPSLPSLRYAMQANASYVRPVILRSAPPGGHVWIITQLLFDVCKRIVQNPYDTGRCPHWREADPQNPMYLAGTYAFQVFWSGGRHASGQRTIYNDGGNEPQVYVLP